MAFCTAATSQAALWDIFTSSAGSDWQHNTRLMNDQSPLGKDLVLWLTATTTTQDIEPRTLIRFVLENSDWPKIYEFRKRIEDGIENSGLKPFEIAAWFDQNPPRTANALKAYVLALNSLKQTAKIGPAIKKFWHSAELDKAETIALAQQYGQFIDNADRLDNLLWEDRFSEAEYMIYATDSKKQPLVSANARAIAEARIALGRVSSKASKLVKKVPAKLQNDPGLLYSRLRWRREMNKDGDAVDILMHAPKNTVRPDIWWRERNILARRAIEKRNYRRALDIMAGHGLTTATAADYGTAEWTLGWLELDFLGQPDKAYKHFENFYKASRAAVSKSRAAYWLARNADRVKQPQVATEWYKIAASYPSTFYGQLAYEKLHGHVNADAFHDDQVTPQDQQAFDEDELVQIVRLLYKDDMQKFIDPFLTKLLDQAKTRPDFVLIARLARETERIHFAVEANKQMQLKIGEFMYTEGYPLLPALNVHQPESALIHAIVHRESMFNPVAGSPAGARGLMQLMPATAKQVSRRIGKNYSADKLTDNPEYNVELGAAYLQQLLENYDGFYPLAIAAYNAGPANVSTWIREFGDPRSGKVNLLDWIEQIPIYETRNYIQRVMESYYIYRLRLNQEPRTVLGSGKG